jgi:hypothetical protein
MVVIVGCCSTNSSFGTAFSLFRIMLVYIVGVHCRVHWSVNGQSILATMTATISKMFTDNFSET